MGLLNEHSKETKNVKVIILFMWLEKKAHKIEKKNKWQKVADSYFFKFL